jgi:hypothetical protein
VASFLRLVAWPEAKAVDPQGFIGVFAIDHRLIARSHDALFFGDIRPEN